MKKVAFYRRSGRSGKFSGLKERVVWMIQTRGRPVSGEEIAAVFDVSLAEFNQVARTITRGSGKVVTIIASSTWVTESGIVDRYFDISSSIKYATPTSETAKTRLCTRRAVEVHRSGCRNECIEKAARRRRLINAGLYIDEFEGVL